MDVNRKRQFYQDSFQSNKQSKFQYTKAPRETFQRRQEIIFYSVESRETNKCNHDQLSSLNALVSFFLSNCIKAFLKQNYVAV